MKLSIEKFSYMFCFGHTTPSSAESGDLCNDIMFYKDLEYYEIFDSIQMLGCTYSNAFLSAVNKIFINHGFASKEKFMCFVLSRSMRVSRSPTFFSFMLVCVLVDTIIQGVSKPLDLECFTLAKMASNCLIAIFYRQYVDLFCKENGFEGLTSYCEKLNDWLLNNSSDIDSETESEKSSVDLENLTLPDSDKVIELLQNLKKTDDVDFMLTDFEKMLLYDCDSVPSVIEPSKDIFIKLGDSSDSSKIECLETLQNLNIKSEHTLERLKIICELCKDNCYKHVVSAAKELEVDEI